jgi:dTDP-4-amino-4,6-dideoxygalactose transaminase
VQTPIAHQGYRHVYHQYTIRVPEKRDEWVNKLYAQGVGTGVHYPRIIPHQPFYKASEHLFRVSGPLKVANGELELPNWRLPVAENAAKEVLSLPVHPALQVEDLKKIVQEVLALCE